MTMKRLGSLFRHNHHFPSVLYGLGALLMLTLQTAPHLFPSVWGARPAPIVLYVVCVALFEGARAGATIGLFSGLIWGVYSGRLFGFDALLMLMIGLVAGLLVEWLLRANFLSALLLCTAAVVIRSLLEWFFCYVIFGKEQLLSILLRVYLPGCLYTVLLIPLMYWLVLRLVYFIRRKQRV